MHDRALPDRIVRSEPDPGPRPAGPDRGVPVSDSAAEAGGERTLDWQRPYTVSQSLTLEVSTSSSLLGASSVSRPAQEISLDAMPVLLAFAAGATPRRAFTRLEEEWEIEEEGFEVVVSRLIEQNFLTPQGQTAPRLASAGFASLLAHHHMLRDPVRVMSYQSAIHRHCRDKMVVEIGCGSGILSIFAAKAGARRVIAIEESEIAHLARRMFEANGCADRIDLRLGNSRDVELDEPADVVVHEILGVDPFVENILPFIDDARRRFLGPSGRLLPHRLEVGCVGLELEPQGTRDKPRVLAEAQEFAGLYGVDFSPYLAMLEAMPARQFRPPVPYQADGTFGHRVLSEPCPLLELDLSSPDLLGAGAGAELERRRVPLELRETGLLSGVALYFRAHLDDEIRLSTSPFAPRTSWGYDVRWLGSARPVEPGQRVELEVEVTSFAGKQRLAVDLPGPGEESS